MLRLNLGLRQTTWIVMCFLLVLAEFCSYKVYGQTPASTTTVYGTVTEHDSGQEVRVPETIISFMRSDGVPTTVRADTNGEFRVTLPSAYAYSVSVSRKGFCPAGRPPFEARSQNVLFNFILTTNCPKDVVVIPGKENAESAETVFCANASRYYCDEQIAVTKSIPVMVRFVTREVQGHLITYGSHVAPSVKNSVRSAPLAGYSVIVAFDTTTISADNVTLDSERGSAVARGNVSITHDSEQLSAGSECMEVFISDVMRIAQPCERSK
jgi:hypothetical protein